MATKVCKVCNIEKSSDQFRPNLKTCLRCQYDKNKIYLKRYYEMHKTRLINENKENYYKKNPVRNPNGRPRKYKPECELEKESVLSC